MTAPCLASPTVILALAVSMPISIAVQLSDQKFLMGLAILQRLDRDGQGEPGNQTIISPLARRRGPVLASLSAHGLASAFRRARSFLPSGDLQRPTLVSTFATPAWSPEFRGLLSSMGVWKCAAADINDSNPTILAIAPTTARHKDPRSMPASPKCLLA